MDILSSLFGGGGSASSATSTGASNVTGLTVPSGFSALQPKDWAALGAVALAAVGLVAALVFALRK